MTPKVRPTSSRVSGSSAGEAVAQLDHLALALGQRVERLAHALLLQVLARFLEGLQDRVVGDEVAELGFVLVADRFLQRDRQLGDAEDVADVGDRPAQLVGDLRRLGLAAEQLHQLALDVGDPVQLLDHVDGDADRPRLVGDRPRHRLADPPGRVGGELVAAPVVELLDRADQPQEPSWIRSRKLSPRPR